MSVYNFFSSQPSESAYTFFYAKVSFLFLGHSSNK
jgi:hypothetical protein